MRCFVALIPDETVSKTLEHLSVLAAQKFDGVKKVERTNIHLTLKFFSNLGKKQINLLKKWLNDITTITEPIKMVCNNSGYFPCERNPKVFWIGQQNPHPIIDHLHKNLEDYCATIFFEKKDDRLFQPHITVGRIKNYSPLDDEFKKIFENENIEIIFRNLALVESTLTALGAKHEIIFKKTFEKELF